jgi:hypothetical protein
MSSLLNHNPHTSEADLTAIELERRMAEVRAMEIRNKIAAEFEDSAAEGNRGGSRLTGGQSRIQEEMQRAGSMVEGDKENSHQQKEQSYQQHRQQQQRQAQLRMQQMQMQKQMEKQMQMQGQMDALRNSRDEANDGEAELSDAAIVGQLAEENDRLRAQITRSELRSEEMQSSQKLKESVLQNQMAEFWTQLQHTQGALEKEKARFCRIQRKLRQMQGLDLETLSAFKLEDLGEQLEKALHRVQEDKQRRKREDVRSSATPHEYLCPITALLFHDPVLARDGHTYERSAIENWFDNNPLPTTRSPMTNEVLQSLDLLPNVALRKLVTDFRTDHGGEDEFVEGLEGDLEDECGSYGQTIES